MIKQSEIDKMRMEWTKEKLVDELRRTEEINALLIKNLIGLECAIQRNAHGVLNEINLHRNDPNHLYK